VDFAPRWIAQCFNAFFLHKQLISLKGCFEAAWSVRISTERSRFGFLAGGCGEITGLAAAASSNGNCQFELVLCSAGSWASECVGCSCGARTFILDLFFFSPSNNFCTKKNENIVQNYAKYRPNVQIIIAVG